MKCEERIGEYCRQAVSYKKFAEYRRCDRCCIDRIEIAEEIADVEIMLEQMKLLLI